MHGPSRVLHDLRHAIRLLRNSPGFSALAITTIALAIGANTAMFSFVNGVLLSPLPYPESDRIVRVLEKLPTGGLNGISTLNQTLARREFRDEIPIGRHIVVQELVPGKTELGQEIAWEIIGVIAGEKITGLGDEISAGMYVSNQQSPTYGINLIVRAGMPPQSLQRAVRSAIDSVNKDQCPPGRFSTRAHQRVLMVRRK